ncbi:hypothetical protein [Komagataeibacter sp. FNDCR2]|uniref:hypothetical protein n=1 Tax=Komagataeibacter sp. FNDCR2 TaxID=2878682 RepID=UPI001E60A423|nr:hypothetical protein [Komagataeibacter sp. FNDCR2]MCE2576003.1 hypothetical protein [Komagataeibacter sp. FNDCR2]
MSFPLPPSRPILRRAIPGGVLALCLALAGLPRATHAAPAYPAPIMGSETTAHAWGIDTRFARTTPCRVEITLNQTIFLAHMPEMIRAGIFNAQVTPALQQQAPHYLMNTLQTDVTPGFVHTLFTQRNAPASCHFAWSYTAPDGATHPMLGFDMTRQAHDRIDWTRLRFGDMLPMAGNLTVDREFDVLVNQETVDVSIALSRSQDQTDLPPPTGPNTP